MRTWWHWWFLGQTDKPAEALISADPSRWYQTPPPEQMGAGNHADAWAAFRDLAVVHGMCEDYRAGLRVDRAHEEADRAAGRKITCPVLLLVSADDDLDIHGDPRPSGGPGRPATYAAASFIPATTRPKKRQKRSPRHFCSSSGRKVSACSSTSGP